MWAAAGPGEVQQAREPGHLAELGLARRTRAQVLAEGPVVVVGETTEDIGTEQQVQVVAPGRAGHAGRAGRHRVTPISSRMTRRLRTA